MRVRAHNVHGWSEWSDLLEIKAAGLPEQPLPPTTSINNNNVKVSWVDPIDNEEAITQYRVVLALADHVTYVEATEYCDGSDPVIFELKTCDIPLANFKALPYEYVAGEEVWAKF